MKKVICIFVISLFLAALSYAQRPDSPSGAAQNKVSLDIKGMDVVDVIKMIGTRAGLNIVIGKNVTGRVTLFLKDVNAWDAFEIVLLANDLAYDEREGIINVMTQRDYELLYGERFQDKKEAKVIRLKYAKAADLSRALNQIKSNLGRIVVDEGSNTVALIDSPGKIKEMEDFVKTTDLPVETRVFSLNYAQADKLQPKIQESLTKGVGYLRIDERTNKIAVTDYPAKINELSKVISAFDEKTMQVIIDAQIIEVKPSDKFEMGVDWDYWIKSHFQVKSALPINTANALIIGTPNITPSKKGDYKGIVDLLRTIGEINILSSPRVMALNNQEAKIHIGTRDAYITSTTSQSGSGTSVTSQSVNFVDWGIQLSVTPTISRDDFITMKIKPEVSDSTRTDIKSENQITQIPIITTSEAETTVMVKDGVTIIMGGLTKDKREKTVKKIPVIGDIPGLGFFFRSTSDNVTKTDLVILLTPHIVSGEYPITEPEEIRPKEGAFAKMVNGKIVTEKVSRKDISLDEYYQSLLNRVQAFALFDRSRKEKGEIKLAFTLSNKGKLVNEPEVLETTNPGLNQYALKAIRQSSPFPPFPKGLDKKEETFKVTLSCE